MKYTPGVIFTKTTSCSASINIQLIKTPYETNELKHCRENWELPNGDLICDILEYYQKMRQLSMGYFYDYIKSPPLEWLEIKKQWHRIARSIIKYNKQNIDTMGQLELSPIAQQISEYHQWKKIEKTFIPKKIVNWYDPMIFIRLFKNLPWEETWPECILWTDSVAIGEFLAYNKMLYFGSGDDEKLLDHVNNSKSLLSIVCSIAAHSYGKNLQRYNQNIVLTPAASGKTWEQLIGRTHRMGQKADEINFYVFLHTPEFIDSWEKALIEAEYIYETTGQQQKLLLSTIIGE
jgi:hypothetical protein